MPFDISKPHRPGWASRWLAPCGVAVLCLLVYGDVLFGFRSGVLSAANGDGCGQFIYWRKFAFDNLRAGRIAQWDPHVYCGLPFFGAWQAAILYPPNWLYLLLPVTRAIAVDAFCSTLLAGIFSSLLARKHGISPVGQLLAGAAAMLSGAYFSHVWPGHLTALAAMAWTPLALLAADEILDSPRLKPVLCGILAFAMQLLAGHPQTVYITGLAVALYSLVRLARAEHRWRAALSLAAMPIGGCAIAAVQLLAGLQASSEGIRSHGDTFTFVSQYSFPPINLLTLVAPYILGDMAHVAYWGQWEYWEACGFVGVVVVALAVAGWRRAAIPRRNLWATMVVIMTVAALGKYTPALSILYHTTPGFATFRATNRFFYVATLFLALLAGAGYDCVSRSPAARRVSAIAAGAVAIVAAALGGWVSVAGTKIYAWVQGLGDRVYYGSTYSSPAYIEQVKNRACASLFEAAGVAVLALLLILAISRDRKAAYALAALCLIELFCFARGMVTTFPVSDAYPPQLEAWYQDHPGDFRVLQLGYAYNSAIAMNRYDIWGYDPLVPRRYTQVLTATQGGNVDEPAMYMRFERPTLAVRIFGCRYVLSRTAKGEVAYSVPDPLPGALMVYSYALLPTRPLIFDLILSPSFNGRNLVALEQPPGITPEPPAFAPTAAVRWLDTDTMEVDARTQTPGILLVNENYSRFWTATALPGASQATYKIQPGNYTQIAIPVGAGVHRMRLHYCPSLYPAGAVVSAIAVLAFAAASLGALWRERSFGSGNR